MPSASDFPALTSPVTLAGRRLRNRVAHASMTTRMQKDGGVTDALIRYYANRAEGGAALVVSEPLALLASQEIQPKVRVRDRANADGLRRWADSLAAHDSLLLAQVQDPGRGRHHTGRSVNAIAPSALPDDLSWSMPQALTADAVRSMVDEFADSAALLAEYGFAGVEISAGHGHLFHQFLSPHSNRRTDAYGGDWTNRTRLLAELIAAIKAACGRGFILGLKLPGDDGVAGGVGPDEAAIIADLLTRGGEVDYVCFAQGAHARSLDMHLPDRYGPPMPYRQLTATLRPSCNGVPLMALGRITDPAEAEALVAGGEADLVGLGRPLLADPAWLNKAVQGRTDAIRYCLSCNTCWGYGVQHGRALCCVNNPRVARADEVDFWPAPAERKRRIVVVGAGVAGMEAAWIAAARGHEVTVFGAGPEVGGKARLRALLPGGETITSVYDYQHSAARRSGVRIELGITASAEDVRGCDPDTVVLATGSRMLVPDWIPPDFAQEGLVPDLHAAMIDVVRLGGRQPGTAVIFDMDHSDGVYAAAEHLHGVFDRVVIVTPRDTVASELWLVARQGILRRLNRKGIEVVSLAEPRWTDAFEEGALDCVNVYTGDVRRIDDLAFLAYATPRLPADELDRPLREIGVEVLRIGDCRAPRDLLHATQEGHEAGCTV